MQRLHFSPILNRTIMLKILTGLFALFLGCQSASAADTLTPPDVLAKTTTQEVLAILKADKDIQGGNMQKVYELVEAKILPNFDFNRMTQLAVGKHWNQASATQKQSLVTEFRNLLVRTYAGSLTQFSNQTVDFKPFNMKPGEQEVVIKSEVKQAGGQVIPIDYSMYQTAFGWKVYDVSIDNVSLVTNYRSSFAAKIRQSGIDGLIAQLASQSQKQATPAKKRAKTGS